MMNISSSFIISKKASVITIPLIFNSRFTSDFVCIIQHFPVHQFNAYKYKVFSLKQQCLFHYVTNVLPRRARNLKRRGRSPYLLSVEAEIFDKNGVVLPVRLVYVRKRGKKKEYLVLLSTDMSLSEEEIIRIYGKRWQVEIFFKVCKSYLRLTKECHSTSYDAMVAWNAIVMSRYMMLALDKRLEEDSRSFGELFYDTCDELPDITFGKALLLLLDTFLNVVAERYLLADDEIESLLEAFINALPEPFKKTLQRCA